jgi:hypothetical protein
MDDGDLATGRIGLYCWGNTGACFAEVRVAAPVWVPYYTFEREARLPAGTRVRIYAGNVADAPSDELVVVRRFKASLDERGQLRFPANGVDLRVGAPASTVGHTRRFLPENEYGRVESVRVLRKADGTGFFLLPPPGVSVFTEGQHRLKLTYRRDNRAAKPDSQVLSEAGNSADESVIIDVPW